MRTAQRCAWIIAILVVACTRGPKTNDDAPPITPPKPATHVQVTGGPTAFDTFSCAVTDARSANPATTASIAWFVNGERTEASGAQVAGIFVPGDKLSCQASLSVGGVKEPPVAATAVTVVAPDVFEIRNDASDTFGGRMGTPDNGLVPICGGTTDTGAFTLFLATLDAAFRLSRPLYVAAPYSCKASFIEGTQAYVFGWGAGFSADYSGAAMFVMDSGLSSLRFAQRFANGVSSVTLHHVTLTSGGFVLSGQTHPDEHAWVSLVTRDGQLVWQFAYSKATPSRPRADTLPWDRATATYG